MAEFVVVLWDLPLGIKLTAHNMRQDTQKFPEMNQKCYLLVFDARKHDIEIKHGNRLSWWCCSCLTSGGHFAAACPPDFSIQTCCYIIRSGSIFIPHRIFLGLANQG